MKKNEILKIHGTEYKKMTKLLLAASDLASMIPAKDCRIGIKPNLVSPTPASFGATTHPEIVAGIIEYLQENAFSDIVLLEGSWVGDRTEEAIDICGYRTLCETYGIPFYDTQKDASFEKDCAGLSLSICRSVQTIDFLINVPVLKGHCQTKMTCALKNMKGLIPNREKRRFHSMGLHKPIAHLNAGIRQDFIVIDQICGDPDCEDGGNPLVSNCIMTAADPVLADTLACRLLGYDTAEVPYVEMAARLGLGSADLQAATLYALDPDSGRRVRIRPDSFSNGTTSLRRFFDLHELVEEVESCSACYANLIPALDRLKEEGFLESLPAKICIGQGFRGQTGPLGCGNCTARFDTFIPGCPPDEADIYTALKSILL